MQLVSKRAAGTYRQIAWPPQACDWNTSAVLKRARTSPLLPPECLPPPSARVAGCAMSYEARTASLPCRASSRDRCRALVLRIQIYKSARARHAQHRERLRLRHTGGYCKPHEPPPVGPDDSTGSSMLASEGGRTIGVHAPCSLRGSPPARAGATEPSSGRLQRGDPACAR